MKFETTDWTLVVNASAANTEIRRIALAGLCEAYWYPLYSFARARGQGHEDAADLTQAFLVHLIEKHGFEGLAPAHGKFRAFLLASFKNFQSDARHRAAARKRGGDLIHIAWDDFVASGHAAAAANSGDPGQCFARNWALTVIERARLRLRETYVGAGKAHEFETLLPYLAPEHGDDGPTATLARALGSTKGAARVALYRFRRRFATALRAEVAATVSDPGDVEAELQFLIAAVASEAAGS
jgi:RNA polymerase sigma-70 factor (ECF subfamily)